jgi:hypothetical protein
VVVIIIAVLTGLLTLEARNGEEGMVLVLRRVEDVLTGQNNVTP